MARNKMELIGRILTEAAATGNTKLTGMLGEFMQELSKEEPVSTAAQASDMPEGTQYVVCIEATTDDGRKLQHPLVGNGYAMSNNIDDVKMTVSDNLIELQRSMESLARTIENAYPVKVRYIPVSKENLQVLEKKLKMLLQNLSDAIDEAARTKAEAYGIMNVEVRREDLSDEMLADIIKKTLYAGAALTEDGQVVDRVDGEKYREEMEIANRKANDDYDEDEDDWNEDEDDDYDDDSAEEED